MALYFVCQETAMEGALVFQLTELRFLIETLLMKLRRSIIS